MFNPTRSVLLRAAAGLAVLLLCGCGMPVDVAYVDEPAAERPAVEQPAVEQPAAGEPLAGSQTVTLYLPDMGERLELL